MAARGMGHSYNLVENPLIMLCLLKMSTKVQFVMLQISVPLQLCGDW